jgi:hypothetical protein
LAVVEVGASQAMGADMTPASEALSKDFAVTCTLCMQLITSDDFDADVMGDDRNPEMFIIIRCCGCATHTTVCNGGQS